MVDCHRPQGPRQLVPVGLDGGTGPRPPTCHACTTSRAPARTTSLCGVASLVRRTTSLCGVAWLVHEPIDHRPVNPDDDPKHPPWRRSPEPPGQLHWHIEDMPKLPNEGFANRSHCRSPLTFTLLILETSPLNDADGTGVVPRLHRPKRPERFAPGPPRSRAFPPGGGDTRPRCT